MTDPTERSIPPVTMTAVWPSATRPMNARFRVTLKKLSWLAKVGDAAAMPTQSTRVATVTQNGCALDAIDPLPLTRPRWPR
jgi:hypothetical protein